MPTLKTVEAVLDEPDEGPADVAINLSCLDLYDDMLIPLWEKLGGTTEGTGKKQLVTTGLHERVISFTCNENFCEKLPGLAENLEGKLPNLFGIAFYNNNLHDDAFHGLFTVLKHCTKLQVLNLRKNVMGDNSANELVKAMAGWPALTACTLDVSNNKAITAKYGQPLLDQALCALESGIWSGLPKVLTSVEQVVEEDCTDGRDVHLWLQTKRLRDDNAEELWVKLAAENFHSQVRVLRIENNYFAKMPGFADLFGGKFHNLQIVALENNRLDDEGLNEVLQVLQSRGSCGTGLQELCLAKNDLSDEGLQRLAEVLCTFPSLTSVTFKGNEHSEMTREGMAAVAMAMSAHPSVIMDDVAAKYLPKPTKASIATAS